MKLIYYAVCLQKKSKNTTLFLNKCGKFFKIVHSEIEVVLFDAFFFLIFFFLDNVCLKKSKSISGRLSTSLYGAINITFKWIILKYYNFVVGGNWNLLQVKQSKEPFFSFLDAAPPTQATNPNLVVSATTFTTLNSHYNNKNIKYRQNKES